MLDDSSRLFRGLVSALAGLTGLLCAFGASAQSVYDLPTVFIGGSGRPAVEVNLDAIGGGFGRPDGAPLRLRRLRPVGL